MSLQVNLSAPGIRQAYEAVLSGEKDYLILTYEKSSNDLRVQSQDKGDLDDLSEEFSDGRIQYAFVRVQDPNSQLPKFVLINWCGEGLPENRKGLFASHSAAVAQYLKAYHVSIQARAETDVSPAIIMKKVTDSSGSKYSAGGTAANTAKAVPIAPVGSSYKPIGTPDIKGMQASAAKKDVIAPVGTAYQSKRDELANIRSGATPAAALPPRPSNPTPISASTGAGSAPAVRGPSFGSAAAPTTSSTIKTAPTFGGGDDADDFAAPKPGAPPAPSDVAPSVIAPAPVKQAAPGAAPSAPQKPVQDDRIGPVGTAYEPVKLAKPGKLGNRFPFGQQAESIPASAPRVPSGSGAPGKLTWSQRQEQAKLEREREEGSAAAKIQESKAGIAAAVGLGAGAGVGAAAVAAEEAPPAPPAPPGPPAPPVDEVAATTQQLADKGVTAVAIYDYEAGDGECCHS